MARFPQFAIAAGIFGLLFFAPVADAKPASQKVDRALRGSLTKGAATQRVIISVNPGCRDYVRDSLRAHGDRINSEHPFIEALTGEIHSEDIEELTQQPCVKAVSMDAVVVGHAVGNRVANRAYNALQGTLGVWKSNYTGSGVVVAVIDSGLQPSADFSNRIKAFYDFTRGGIKTAAFDDWGHGTFVAGLIGSKGNLSYWYEYQGVAPGVKFVGLKVLDATGQGQTSQVIQAIDFAIANKVALGIDIINLSLGHPVYEPASTDPLVQAVERASAAGIVVVTAAGNYGRKEDGMSGYAGISSPGNAPSSITVGSETTAGTTVRSDDGIADYSSRGPTWYDGFAKPDLVAPGDKLVSNAAPAFGMYKKKPSLLLAKNLNYGTLSGTSMAAGVTSGVVALVLEANRNAQARFTTARLTPNAVKAILQYTALPLHNAQGVPYDALTQGAGGLNGAGAVALAAAINLSVPKGSWWLATGVTQSSTIGDETLAWGQSILWGSSILWGNSVYTNAAAWSQNVVWGKSILWGSSANILWGTNVVWSSPDVWGSNIVWGNRLIGQKVGPNSILWGNGIVWGTLDGDSILWGTSDGDSILWGSWDGDSILWGSSDGDSILWGSSDGDSILWGSADDILWGTLALEGIF